MTNMAATLKSAVLLVEPAAFDLNVETVATNRFQLRPASASTNSQMLAATAGNPQPAVLARAEFTALVAALRKAQIRVAVAPDTPLPAKPDAVFPNNWVSFHADGTIVVYPLLHPSRRPERREAVIDCVKRVLGFTERRRLDLTEEESRGRFLEGTGSLVLDAHTRTVFACRSPRTDAALVQEWARQMDYDAFVFDAATPDGTPVYHTNVLLWIGESIVGAGLEWVDAPQRKVLSDRLSSGGRRLLTLDAHQLQNFAGNMLELASADDERHLVMSARAAESLTPKQHSLLREIGSAPVISAVPTIENLGGGSVRCMLAEVPLLA
jgi:hypothetical protein